MKLIELTLLNDLKAFWLTSEQICGLRRLKFRFQKQELEHPRAWVQLFTIDGWN